MILRKGPFISPKWNKKGNCILTGSIDQTAAVWDAETGKLEKQFTFLDAPTLDVDWKDDKVFASCSIGKLIYMCSGDSNSNCPKHAYEKDGEETNWLKFDPFGKLLASCSDNYTAPI